MCNLLLICKNASNITLIACRLIADMKRIITVMSIREKFGKRVRAERLKLEMSQEELAHEASSNRTYVSDVERGRRNPSIEIVERIAKALNVKMGDLLD